jgi:hypothetical protein
VRPPGVTFDQPEQAVFTRVILMEDEAREGLFETAGRVRREALGIEGEVTVDVGYRAEVWKARRHR